MPRISRWLLALLAAILTLTAAPATTSAFHNGQAPPTALARIYHPAVTTQVRLARAPAAAWNTMVICARADHVRLYAAGPMSGYRTYAQQVLLARYWTSLGRPANAAHPGTSNHGLGLAVDLGSPTVMRVWIDHHGAQFGWAKRWSDASWEPWHLRWRSGIWKHRPNPGPYPDSPRLRRGSSGKCVGPVVRRVQRALHVHPSGVYGRSTRAAIVRLQHRHHLVADGVMGPGTWRALRRELKAHHQPARKPVVKRPARKVTPVKSKPEPALGVDVSVYQGSINWTRVRAAGYRFAVLKATEGVDYSDRTFTAARIRAVRAAGLYVSAYHFLRPRPGRDARNEARWFVAHARAAGWRRRDLPLVADLENTRLSAAATLRYVSRFAAEVRRRSGRQPILYTYPGFWSGRLGTHSLGLRLWIAHYRVSSPLIPVAWRSRGYSLWQYNDSAAVPGIPTHVDVDLVAGGVPALEQLRGH